jgi:hypothetical protein
MNMADLNDKCDRDRRGVGVGEGSAEVLAGDGAAV